MKIKAGGCRQIEPNIRTKHAHLSNKPRNLKRQVRKISNKVIRSTDSSSLTGIFLDLKLIPSLEIFWDIITKVQDRKLYFQLRVGSLPIKSFTSRWAPQSDCLCPACMIHNETIAHMFFACLAYAVPRRVWLTPVCKLLGTRRSTEVGRILCTSTVPFIVVAVAKFLGWAWILRQKIVSG